MPASNLSLFERPAARYVIFLITASLLGILAVTYTVLGFYALQHQQSSGWVFLQDVKIDINHKIENYEESLNGVDFIDSPVVASYDIIIFEPNGSTVKVTSQNNKKGKIPKWATTSNKNDQIIDSYDGFEAWQQLDNNYKMYIQVDYQPLINNFNNPIYGLPILVAVLIELICLIQLRKRYEAWDELMNYMHNLQQAISLGYEPLQINAHYINSELQALAQIINRFAFKVTQKSLQIKDLDYRQRMLVDNAPLPLFLINRKGKLIYFNDRFAQLFNTPFNKNVVFMLSDFITGIDKTTQQLITGIGKTAILATLSVTNLQRDMYFDLRLNPFYNHLGKLQGYSGNLEIVTGYYEQLQQAWLSKKQQSEKLASFDKVWAVLGHELRTPLGGMIGMIDLLSEDKDQFSTEQQETLTTLQQSSHNMLQLLNDMLDLAKMNAGKLQTNISNVDILLLLRQVAELMSGNARRQNISLYLHVDPAAPRYIESDDGRLRQILLNLMSNAIKFTKKGYVAILIDKVTNQHPIIQSKSNVNLDQEDWIKISVKDSGIGIHEQEQKKLFSYFNQANDSISRQFGGTGLGLAISNNFSHMLGGFIHLDSQAGEGSEFQVFLPLTKFSIQPVFNFKAANLPVYIIVISPYTINKLFTRILDNFNIPSVVLTDINEGMVDYINHIKFLDLKPVFVVDDVGYDKALFSQITIFEEAIKILVSIENERIVDPLLLTDFDGLIQKPLLTNSFFAEVTRLYDQKYNQNKKVQRHVPPQLAFKQFLQRQKIEHLPATEGLPNVSHQPTISTTIDTLGTSTPVSSLNKTRNKTVLIAEDNPVNQKIAKKHLTNLGYPVLVANDGEQAIELLSEHRAEIGLVLMDCRMPILDGLEATRAIRANKDSIPIIALTANDTDDDKRACTEAGMNAFLTKPLSKVEIQSIINRYMV